MLRPEASSRTPRALAALALGVAAALAALTGCTTAPLSTTGPKRMVVPLQREAQAAAVAGRSLAPQPAVIAFCYGNLVNTPEQIARAAQETCDEMGGERLVYVGEDSILTPCPLLQPVRATYVCHPPAGGGFTGGYSPGIPGF